MNVQPLSKPLLDAKAKDISHAWNRIAVKSKNFAEELVDYGLRGNVSPKFVLATDLIDYKAFDSKTEELTPYAKRCIKYFFKEYGPKNKKPEEITLWDYIKTVTKRMNDEKSVRDPFIDYSE